MTTETDSRVLVVDDIEENLKVLSETLKHNGLYPLQAKNGERAIEIAKRAQPDVILLDIQMPGLDGYQTIARLQADPQTHDIPVIFISALADIDDKIKGFRAGGVDYVSKPFREEEVIARVMTHIRLRRAMQEIETERQKSDRLLQNVLPAPIAEQLKRTGTVAPQVYPDVTVLFSDMVDFTRHSQTLTPDLLIAELNDIFTLFDAIIIEEGGERIKTIGDAYLAVAGMHPAGSGGVSVDDAPTRMVRAAIRMRDAVSERSKQPSAAIPWQVRIGIHTGEVIGGIVGTRKYLFDIFGDTVNTASRMESISAPMDITISEATLARVSTSIRHEPRGSIEVKGKGTMDVSRVIE